jgi:AraC-like DNA-binding protein
MGGADVRSILKVRMIGSIVLTPESEETQESKPLRLELGSGAMQRMDPLSEILALIKPDVYVSGGFAVREDTAICFPSHQGIKCYAMLAGHCWLVVEGVADPVLVHAGDCFLLPHGLPFQLTTDLSLEPVLYTVAFARLGRGGEVLDTSEGRCYIAGGHFPFAGVAAEMILRSLPSIVHIRRESDKAAMRWSLERMRAELSQPQPGTSLIAQHLAYTMLIQALRLHLTDAESTGPGWLAALADKQMSLAIVSMHGAPGYGWTLQSLAEKVGMSRSVFALRFRETVGVTPMEYLTRWRMLLAADRLKNSSDGLAAIAQLLGYESESAFGKAFRRVMGCSPRQYARRGEAL